MRAGVQRYHGVARTLHWVIATLVIFNLTTGLLNDAIEDTIRVIPVHKAVGLTILALSLIRLGWRLAKPPPPLPQSVARGERLAAGTVHTVFYALMLVMPLTGYIMASAGRYPLEWFGLFEVPKLAVDRDGPLYAVGRQAHSVLGWLFLALVGLHIGAALRHHFILRDDVLRRMV